MASIFIRDLSKRFRKMSGEEFPVLDRLSIQAGDSEFVCLLGPSGSGKSTTLNILAGLVQPDSGQVLVNGHEALGRANFGYVFQRPRLLLWRTVRQNVTFSLKTHGVSRDRWDELANRYLHLVGLTGFFDEYPMALSGGMQQRVAIARALAIEPDILLMDEPFSGLDELTARSMRLQLLDIWRQTNKTVLFVTHNALEAVFLADKIYLLSSRPATVFREVRVDLPRPRRLEDPALVALHGQIIRDLVGDEAEVGAA